MAKFWLEDSILKSDESLDDFDIWQGNEIKIGLKQGLSQEQIALYAKIDFSYDQMEQIRLGLETGLTIDQVSIYAKPEFDWSRMQEIRYGLESGLTTEQVLLYANPKFGVGQMYEIRCGLESGMDISCYLDEAMNSTKMNRIRMSIENNIIETIRLDLAEKGLTCTEVKDFKLKSDGIYFCDDFLISFKDLQKMHPNKNFEPDLNYGIDVDRELEELDIPF